MAHRMAHECADLIAGIAALSGLEILNWPEPSEPVNILHIIGTADGNYLDSYGTNPNNPNTPLTLGAMQTIQRWAGYNDAHDPLTDSVRTLDLTTEVSGLDTMVTRYTSALPGGAVELWTMSGAGHGTSLSAQFPRLVIDWLLTHPKP